MDLCGPFMKRSRRAGRVFASVLLVAACLTSRGVEAGQEGRAGRATEGLRKGTPLADALRELEGRGLKLVYSSRVVLAEMTVLEEPTATADRQILDQLLAPHRLAVENGPGGSLVVVPGPVREAPGRPPGLDASSRSRQPFRDVRLRQEVVVLPSRISLLSEEPEGPLALGRDDILRLPHLGGDVFRALSLMPGTASNEVTAQLHVRGGRRDELLVLLDGQELYEAYHLKDFDSALSLVAASALERLSLTTGAFPASFGDRMGGVLDLSTVSPSPSLRFGLAVSFVTAQLSGSGSFGERGGWLVSGRRGLADLAGPLVGAQRPTFWDVLGRTDFRPGPTQAIRLNFLVSGDGLADTAESAGEITSFDTDYDSAYAWLAHEAVLGDRLFVQTSASGSEVRRDRLATEIEEETDVAVRDGRRLSVLGAQQSWSLQLGENHSVKAGLEWRRFDSEYDYESDVSFSSPLAALRSWTPDGPFVYRDRLRDDATGLFVSGRFQPAPAVTLEAGARYDRHTVPGEGVLSPRVGIAWGLGSGGVLRVAWGRYAQGQRVYELQVEDGDTTVYPIERSTQWVAGFEHLFDGGQGFPLVALRIEGYRRRVSTPRVRYESLFEAFEPIPEGAYDRVRVEPETGTADGVEVSLRGRAGRRIGWWLNSSLGTAEDVIDGGTVRRRIEQRHTVNVDVNVDLGRRWALNLAWRYHTGWPITSVSLGSDVSGEPVPALGPLNGDRLPPDHRLDLRFSRTWKLSRGSFAAFVDAQNLYNRKNVAGYDLEIDGDQLVSSPETWPGFFLSAGFTLEF